MNSLDALMADLGGGPSSGGGGGGGGSSKAGGGASRVSELDFGYVGIESVAVRINDRCRLDELQPKSSQYGKTPQPKQQAPRVSTLDFGLARRVSRT
jgi:hypothetical protein